MATILGLLTTESFANERFKNIRRSVFYFYPNGAAPLIGLMSLLKEEVTNDPEYRWYEKYLLEQRTTTASIGSNVAVYTTVSADYTTTWTAASGNFTWTSGTLYGLKVASTSVFRVGHMIKFATIVSGTATEAFGRVEYVDTDNTRLAVRAVESQTAASTYNSAAGIGQEVLVIGNAFHEGAVGSSYNPYNTPINPYNYTQIFRTAWQITGTQLKTSIKYDETGAYGDQAKDASINHMREMEFAYLFGVRNQVTSGTTPIRYTGGIIWFLRQWEAADSIYRGGSGAAAITANTDDDKRIISLTDGYITDKLYNTYLERHFRYTNNKSNEKFVLCGSGFLNVINQLYQSKAVLNADLPMTDTYGMNVVSHTTPFGKIYYKSHPLFNMNSTLRNNALFLEVHNLKYRYVNGRDTELLTERQPNNADYREDEYLTEAGLEMLMPQTAMYLTNVQDWK
jgi:hypothetical protein